MIEDNKEEEIDLSVILKTFKKIFIWCLELFLSVLTFYKKKALLFIGIIVLGVVIGYFLDKRAPKQYYQEIIIEPNVGSTSYIYNSIDIINSNLNNDNFIQKLNLTREQLIAFEKVQIEPIIQSRDVLDILQDKYEDKNRAYNILFDFNNKILEDEKYIDFYKRHKITFKFNQKDSSNIIKNQFFKYILNNEYYKEKINFLLREIERKVKLNRKSLEFIDYYLININNNLKVNKTLSSREIINLNLVSDNIDFSSLLEYKNNIMDMIENDNHFKFFESKIFNIIIDTDLLEEKKSLIDKKIITIPIFIFIVISTLFFMIYNFRKLILF